MYKLRAIHVIFFVLAAVFLVAYTAWADIPAAEEWADVPAVVNVDDDLGLTEEDIDEIIEIANKNLAGAKIRLVRSGTANQQELGGSGGMSRDDRDDARNDGENELPADGTGVKIDIVENCDANSPGTNGVAVHRTPVIIIENDDDPNVTGNTAAHELGHVLTIEGHSSDPNNVMYPYSHTDPNDPNKLRGSNWDPNDAIEIHEEAKTRGRTRWVIPVPPPGGAVAVPAGIDFCMNARGGQRDGLYDSMGTPGYFDPCDPYYGPHFGYADLREVTLYCDRPDVPDSTTIMRTRLRGVFPADSFFNLSCVISLDKDRDMTVDADITIQINGSGTEITANAQYHDYHSGPEPPLLPPEIHFNEEFDVGTVPPANSSFDLIIPTECIISSDFFGPGSDPFDGVVATVVVTVNSDPDLPPGVIQIIDEAGPFDFALTRPVPEQSMNFIELEGGGGGGGGCIALYCQGFDTTTEVQARINGQPVGPPTPVLTDGSALIIINKEEIPTDISGTTAEVSVRGEVPTGQPGKMEYITAQGFLQYCPGGPQNGDLDGDCDVDLYDFAIVADNWASNTL